MRSSSGLFGFPRRLFSMFPSERMATERRPPWLSLRFHPLISFSCPFRVLLLVPPLSFDLGCLPWGYRALFATSTGSVLTMASQGHSLAVLDVSRAFDGFLRFRPCGFISPHCRVQGSPFRGSYFMCSRSTSSVSRALSSLTPYSCKQLPACSSARRFALRALIRT